ncbi:MAG: DNA-3-methyladenine glycosylase [Eubacteriales bacterium]|nr:DNA-3-methyladenine glycosylase [Eubacteriales bacterium]
MRLDAEFFSRDCLEAAPELVGKLLVRAMPDGSELRLRITETEAYRGESDTACHAHRGRTPRTEVMYGPPGTLYVYLCYGIHWMLNIVTSDAEVPQAILLRGCDTAEGPGRLTKKMHIDGTLNRGSIFGDELWVEDDGFRGEIVRDRRIGIGYASKADQDRLWRFSLRKD